MKTDVKQLLDRLDFQPQNVINEAAVNARYFWTASEYRIESLRAKNAAEMDLDLQRSALSLQLRMTAQATGVKITEDGVKSQINIDPSVVARTKALNAAEEEEETAKLLVEAFRMRRDLLRVIADLVHTDASMQHAVSEANAKLTNVRKKIKTKYPGQDA